MIGWLALLVVQNWLALAGNFSWHRRLGWAGAMLLIAIAFLGVQTGVQAVAMHRVPPFWSNATILALALVQVTGFVLIASTGIVLRRHVQWHRRLMLGATIFIFKAALDRLLPVPLIASLLPVVEGSIQLFAIGVLAFHDRGALGKVHPANWTIGVGVVLGHALIALLAMWPPFIRLADNLAA